MTTPVFVYERDHEIRVEDLDTSKELEKNGWKLISSLDPKVYLNQLLREYPSLIRVMKENIHI
jgi:hypothetical protein